MSAMYLAGYDGSAESRAAVELAARLAEPAGAEVTAVHVYSDLIASYLFGTQEIRVDELSEALEHEAEELLGQLDVPGVGRRAVRADSAARGLHDAAEEMGAKLVAVGTTHQGALGRLAPGSVGMHLLHGAPCPILVVPPDTEARPVRRIGVAYDGREESKAALAHADGLAQELAGELVLLGTMPPVMVPVGAAPIVSPTIVEENERAFRAALEQAAGETRAPAQARAMVGPASRTIAEASGDVDILITGSRGYGAIRGVVLGSVSRYLVDHAHCPVMVVPRPS